MFTRRGVILSACLPAFPAAAASKKSELLSRLSEIEKQSGGRLGCAVFDLSTGSRVEHRGGERFPMCSTFKVLAVGLTLKRVDGGLEKLDRRIVFPEAELVAYSPATKLRAGSAGMTVEEICHAALTLSDNTAGNLLLKAFGGPAALTAFARSIGDSMTRLDRIETILNEAIPGDPRDTTTPAAMIENLRKLTVGDVLSDQSRTKLLTWCKANTTGDARLRAGFPGDWITGDKTGSGDTGTTNDIAIAWPPHRKPVLVTAYLTQAAGSPEDRNKILADVGRAVAQFTA